MRRSQPWRPAVLLLLLLTIASFACKKTPAPPPPPPPTTPIAVVVPPPTPAPPVIPAPTITLRADTVTIVRGGTVTLTWDARNASTVDIQPGLGSVTPVTSGSRQVSPAASVTYMATATGPGGPPVQTTLRITVNDPPPPPVAIITGPATVASPPTPTLSIQQLFERDVQSVNFDYDKSDIRDDQKAKLQAAATILKSNPNARVTIEGHADERGSEEYNLALSDRRANAVKQNLVSQGVGENRIDTVSYGEERPVCSDQTEDCYARNRRAAFRN